MQRAVTRNLRMRLARGRQTHDAGAKKRLEDLRQTLLERESRRSMRIVLTSRRRCRGAAMAMKMLDASRAHN
eukprot:461966-Pyramimonas_sp.AAC.1